MSEFDPNRASLDHYARQPWDRVGSHERPPILSNALKDSPIGTNIGMGDAREEHERNGEELIINPIIGGQPGGYINSAVDVESNNDMQNAPFGTQDIWFNPADHTKPYPPMLDAWQWNFNLWARCRASSALSFLVAFSGTTQAGDGTFQIDLLDAAGALVLDIDGNPLVAPQIDITFTCFVSPNPALFSFTITKTTLTYGSGIFTSFNAIRFTSTCTNANLGLLGAFVTAEVWYPSAATAMSKLS